MQSLPVFKLPRLESVDHGVGLAKLEDDKGGGGDFYKSNLYITSLQI